MYYIDSQVDWLAHQHVSVSRHLVYASIFQLWTGLYWTQIQDCQTISLCLVFLYRFLTVPPIVSWKMLNVKSVMSISHQRFFSVVFTFLLLLLLPGFLVHFFHCSTSSHFCEEKTPEIATPFKKLLLETCSSYFLSDAHLTRNLSNYDEIFRTSVKLIFAMAEEVVAQVEHTSRNQDDMSLDPAGSWT